MYVRTICWARPQGRPRRRDGDPKALARFPFLERIGLLVKIARRCRESLPEAFIEQVTRQAIAIAR